MGGKRGPRKPGQIIQRSANSYTVRVYAGRDENGKRDYINHTVRGTRKQAERELTKLLRDQDLGVLIEPSRKTLNEYLDEWLQAAVKARVRERTYEDYRWMMDRYVRPVLGGRKLAKITPVEVQKLYTDMLARELAPRTIRYCHTVLSNAFKQAVKWRMLPGNPCDAVDLPQQAKSEMQAMSESEAAKFTEAVEASPWRVLFITLLTTGLRPSEAAGLKWEDLDLAGARLTVRRTLTRRKGEWRYGAPKRGNGRTIDLPQGTVRLLADQPRRGELVFTSIDGEPAHMGHIAKSPFKDAVKRAGIKKSLRLYDLRHTHATLLLLAGVHPKIVSERLGHSSIQITLDTYSHVLPGMGKESAEKLDAMLFGRAEEPPAVGAN